MMTNEEAGRIIHLLTDRRRAEDEIIADQKRLIEAAEFKVRDAYLKLARLQWEASLTLASLKAINDGYPDYEHWNQGEDKIDGSDTDMDRAVKIVLGRVAENDEARWPHTGAES